MAVAERLLSVGCMTTPAPVPAWKFWHPMPFWQVLLIYAATNIALSLLAAAVATLFAVPGPVIGGGAGLAAYLIVFSRARSLARKG